MNDPVRVPFDTCVEVVEWIVRKRRQGKTVVALDDPMHRLVGFVCEDRHAVTGLVQVKETSDDVREAIRDLFGELSENIPTTSETRNPFSTPLARHWLATGKVLSPKEG